MVTWRTCYLKLEMDFKRLQLFQCMFFFFFFLTLVRCHCYSLGFRDFIFMSLGKKKKRLQEIQERRHKSSKNKSKEKGRKHSWTLLAHYFLSLCKARKDFPKCLIWFDLVEVLFSIPFYSVVMSAVKNRHTSKNQNMEQCIQVQI